MKPQIQEMLVIAFRDVDWNDVLKVELKPTLNP